ncbi:uncharacterized protein K489DRAFT_250788 [Dissoconium aciculare CBS 342.82]|uniref:Uncharacterized protein n=1 Tax=Dissoconium aciculare CBS 342.82 TaxID=1314786 RepID=A0A6J3M0K9_9PEZI|nr:uncharacterized protein K489DRAFT_250788 [Dissoconium aciculare CBS 342.82]KAF1821565.1 hypothetical protein K489DRAFT_250788 [Dissoconium aciculare CBS 342.82]
MRNDSMLLLLGLTWATMHSKHFINNITNARPVKSRFCCYSPSDYLRNHYCVEGNDSDGRLISGSQIAHSSNMTRGLTLNTILSKYEGYQAMDSNNRRGSWQCGPCSRPVLFNEFCDCICRSLCRRAGHIPAFPTLSVVTPSCYS